MPIAYKVVKQLGNNYYSRSISSVNDLGATLYEVGVPAYPNENTGPLTVFDKKSQAEDWIKEWVGTGVDTASATAREHYEIFRCEYEPADEEYLYVISTDAPNRGYTTHISKCPVGTILASSVTLLNTVRWS
jgi:hypothetical protein